MDPPLKDLEVQRAKRPRGDEDALGHGYREFLEEFQAEEIERSEFEKKILTRLETSGIYKKLKLLRQEKEKLLEVVGVAAVKCRSELTELPSPMVIDASQHGSEEAYVDMLVVHNRLCVASAAYVWHQKVWEAKQIDVENCEEQIKSVLREFSRIVAPLERRVRTQERMRSSAIEDMAASAARNCKAPKQ